MPAPGNTLGGRVLGNVIPTTKYLLLTIKHKVFVFMAGLKVGAPILRLIIHDWTKFTPSEAPHYGRQFFGDKSDELGFSRAWLHHQNSNPHHWEYWVPRTGHSRGDGADNIPLPMPEWAIREMIADWMGAGKAYDGRWPPKDWPWLSDNWPNIANRVHPETKQKVVQILDGLGYNVLNEQNTLDDRRKKMGTVTARDFNPSNNEIVDGIKERAEALAEYITENLPESRRREKAITDVESASMFAVKAVFYNDDGTRTDA